jgi:hypothetical protein
MVRKYSPVPAIFGEILGHIFQIGIAPCFMINQSYYATRLLPYIKLAFMEVTNGEGEKGTDRGCSEEV